MKLVNHLDASKLEIRAAVLQVLGTAPSSPVLGQMYYDSGLGGPRYYDGVSAWTNKATDSANLGGQNLAFVLGRANHSGTQPASTISDLASTVKAYRLDEFGVPTANVSFNGQKITNLGTPTVSSDAATMGYVQAQVQAAAAGIDNKPSVRIATTTNDSLTGLAARDGITPIAGDRVLVKSQTTASQNGVYIAASGAWTRASTEDENNELTPGAFWYVEEGTVNGKTQWRIENTGTITVGTTAITINQFGAAGSYTEGNGIDIVGNAISVQTVANGGVSVVAGGVQIDTNIVPRKYSTLIGNGSLTIITVTHNLNTQDVVVSVRDASTNEIVLADVVANGVNTVTVTFASAPALNAYRVTVIG